MSEIVSFYDWYLAQRTKPKGKEEFSKKSKDLLEKDIEDEEE